MKVEKDKVVELLYELVVDGQLADKCSEEQPLGYIHGTGNLLPRFEEEVEGLEPGEKFAFTLSPAEGYGEYNPANVIDMPKDAFIIDGVFREDLIMIGNTIPLVARDGRVVPGVIKGVEKDIVKIDLNHSMAGKTLNFSGKVLTVRDATEKELSEGLHGERAGRGCGGCHGSHGEGEGCCHKGESHGEGEGCCHKGEGHGEGEGCCHKGEGNGEGEGCCGGKA